MDLYKCDTCTTKILSESSLNKLDCPACAKGTLFLLTNDAANDFLNKEFHNFKDVMHTTISG